MTTQIEEITRIMTAESGRLVNYILTLEYDPAETDPDDGYATDAEWLLCMYRRHDGDGDRFDDHHDRISLYLYDAEDRPPTVHDVTDDVWFDLFKDAQDRLGWSSWHHFVVSSRLIVRIMQEAGVP